MSLPGLPEIKYLSESALLLDWGSRIDLDLNRRVHRTAQLIAKQPFPGFTELVPAYSSLAVFYDPFTVSQLNSGKQPWRVVTELIKSYLIENSETAVQEKGELVQIPVLYNGPDLDSLAKAKSLSHEQVISIHTSRVYDVFMLGFLPGFAYLGLVDDRIAMPRLATPRTKVPAGSVGIAGTQTGVYPVESPGGWQLIGTTPIKMFDSERAHASFLRPGDRVQFFPIDDKIFSDLSKAQ